MINDKYRAYLTTGELPQSNPNREATRIHGEYSLLWLLNGHYNSELFSFKMEFGSYKTEGGIAVFPPGNIRYDFNDALSTKAHACFQGRASLAVPNSPRSENEDDLENCAVSLSFFPTDDGTSVELTLRSAFETVPARLKLTDAQRCDLAMFMHMGQPEGMIDYDGTQLVYPDGSVSCVDTYGLQSNPEHIVQATDENSSADQQNVISNNKQSTLEGW